MSFATKPRLTAKPDGIKKPAFLVVRKKASLLKKKNLSEVKSFSSTVQPPVSKKDDKSNNDNKLQKPASHVTEDLGVNTSVMLVNENRSVKKTASHKKKNTQQGGSSGGYNNTGIISSLFFKNPEIPTVTKDKVESTEEGVFSSRSFSALNIHKYLVRYYQSQVKFTWDRK